MQQRLWFVEAMFPGQATYHIQGTHRLIGPLDLGALRQAGDALLSAQLDNSTPRA